MKQNIRYFLSILLILSVGTAFASKKSHSQIAPLCQMAEVLEAFSIDEHQTMIRFFYSGSGSKNEFSKTLDKQLFKGDQLKVKRVNETNTTDTYDVSLTCKKTGKHHDMQCRSRNWTSSKSKLNYYRVICNIEK